MRLSEQDILDKRTTAGGYTKAQLAEWGVSWPPPKGWKKSLLVATVKSEGLSQAPFGDGDNLTYGQGDRQIRMQREVDNHDLWCFGCRRSSARWAKVGTSKRGRKWVVCVRCLTDYRNK